MRESLATRQQSDPELGKLVRLRLQSAEQLALALLSARSDSAQKLKGLEHKPDNYEKRDFDKNAKNRGAIKNLINEQR